MFTPFDPVSKRITAEVEKDGKRYTCAKGACKRSTQLDPKAEKVQGRRCSRAQAQSFATRGFRSLGVASKEDGKDWQLLGICACLTHPGPILHR